MVVVPEVVRDVGLKVAVTPEGSPVAANVTDEENPLFIVSVPVSVVLAVGAIDSEVGATEKV